MTFEEFRIEMEAFRKEANAKADHSKDSWRALDRLKNLYARFDENERQMANRVLEEWVLSDDEGLRFDALAIVEDFKIISAVPVLKQLAVRLKSSNAPGAYWELEKANRVIAELGA